MQPVQLRRVVRRTPASRSNVGQISHTSPSAALAGSIQLSVDFLGIVHDAIQLARAEEENWVGRTLFVAEQARSEKVEARRHAIEEANSHVQQRREEQQQLLAQRDAERRARASELEEQNRLDQERARRERELEEQRRDTERLARAAEREEQVRQERERARREREQEAQRQRDAEEAQRRAVEEAERRRRARLRPCMVCMEDEDLAIMMQLACNHWSCRTCLRGTWRDSRL
jgi:septal ring factor EnvC (AmiA/AmiB activator)